MEPMLNYNVSADRELLDRLADIDWDFRESKDATYTHGFHPYPARFIPDIPRTLIRLLAKEEDRNILDQFCGCGTTLVESVLAGRNAYGIDANPLAVLVSRVKAKPFHRDLSRTISKFIEQVDANLNFQYQPTIPKIPNLDHWFPSHIQRELAIIREEIDGLPTADVQDFFKVAFSAIVVNVSYQESDTRYARKVRHIKRGEVIHRIQKQLEYMNECMIEYSQRLANSSVNVQVFLEDTRTMDYTKIGENAIDLAISSPPYPNVYEYYLYHKYRLYWLGFDPQELRKHEIGVRADYSKKRNLTEDDFYSDMVRCFNLLAHVLKPEKYAVYVIGNSRIKGKVVDNSEILIRAARKCGFSLLGRWSRLIPERRSSFNPTLGRKAENVLLFRNGPKVGFGR